MHNARTIHFEKGFSLVEIMVGLVIGLLAMLVILQMYANFEGQKRTTTSGSDAAENGLAALMTVERDIRMAGMGLADSALLSCTTLRTYYNSNTPGSTGGPITSLGSSLTPIKITDGGTGSDSISMLFGTSFRAGVAGKITENMPDPSAELKVNSTAGFANDDLVIVSDGSTCTLMQVTQVQDAALKLQHNFSSSGPTYNCNAACMANQTPPWTTGFPMDSTIFNMGALVQKDYRVAASGPTSTLQIREFSTTWTPLVSDIVAMQAQYGVSTNENNTATCWVNATSGNACDATNWASPSGSAIRRIKAIRIAVVARSALQEKPSTGSTCNTTTTAPVSWQGGPTINLSADANWQCYRYKVYQTVVPLRNLIWEN